MNTLKKILAALAVAAAALAALGLALEWIRRKDAQMDELDAYLQQEEENDVPVAVLADADYMEQDLDEWDSLNEEQSVQVTLFSNPVQAESIQKDLADIGYSSHYDPESFLLDIEVKGPKTREEISALEKLLKKVLQETDCTYLGFAFE